MKYQESTALHVLYLTCTCGTKEISGGTELPIQVTSLDVELEGIVTVHIYACVCVWYMWG